MASTPQRLFQISFGGEVTQNLIVTRNFLKGGADSGQIQ
jgi:hypothetical protein